MTHDSHLYLKNIEQFYHCREGQDPNLVHVHHQRCSASHGGFLRLLNVLVTIRYSIVTRKNVRMTGSISWKKYQKEKDEIFVVNISSQVVNASVNLPIFFFAGKTFREVTINLVRWENNKHLFKKMHIFMNLICLIEMWLLNIPIFLFWYDILVGLLYKCMIFPQFCVWVKISSNNFSGVTFSVSVMSQFVMISTTKNVSFLQDHKTFIFWKTFRVSLIKTWFWIKLLGVFFRRPCWELHSITQ